MHPQFCRATYNHFLIIQHLSHIHRIATSFPKVQAVLISQNSSRSFTTSFATTVGTHQTSVCDMIPRHVRIAFLHLVLFSLHPFVLLQFWVLLFGSNISAWWIWDLYRQYSFYYFDHFMVLNLVKSVLVVHQGHVDISTFLWYLSHWRNQIE